MPNLREIESPHLGGQAACAQYEPELWYQEKEDSLLAQMAVFICARCPVQADCLEHALAKPEQYGIWGGTMPATRQRILNARRKAVA